MGGNIPDGNFPGVNFPRTIQNIYQGFKELQYVDLLLDLQRIATCKESKNYNMQIYNLIYKELQLEKWLRYFFKSFE